MMWGQLKFVVVGRGTILFAGRGRVIERLRCWVKNGVLTSPVIIKRSGADRKVHQLKKLKKMQVVAAHCESNEDVVSMVNLDKNRRTFSRKSGNTRPSIRHPASRPTTTVTYYRMMLSEGQSMDLSTVSIKRQLNLLLSD